CQNGFTKDELHLMTSVHISSGLAPFLNVQMTSVHISSGLVLHQMVSAENNTSGPVPQCSNDVCSHQFRPYSSSNGVCENKTSGPVPQCSNDVCSHQFRPRSLSY
ncbi:hypothetical protein Tco_1397635, partial [Tanacetum coccineum]